MAEAVDSVLSGASVANPYAALAGAALSAATGGPSSAQAGSYGNLGGASFDSPWNITFGDNSALTAPYSKTTDALGMGKVSSYLPYAVLAVGALVAVRVLRKR